MTNRLSHGKCLFSVWFWGKTNCCLKVRRTRRKKNWSFRASSQTGVGIPLLGVTCRDTVLLTGGSPHQRARWFAMTGSVWPVATVVQTTVCCLLDQEFQSVFPLAGEAVFGAGAGTAAAGTDAHLEGGEGNIAAGAALVLPVAHGQERPVGIGLYP